MLVFRFLHIIIKMGISHSKHRQYLENSQRVHGYEKSTNRKTRSVTHSYQTKNQLRFSNKNVNSLKESDGINGNLNKNKDNVVYYSSDDVEMAGEILQKIKKYEKKTNANKQKVEKSQSQTKLPSFSSQQIVSNNPQYIIKINKDRNHNQVAIIEDIPSNESIIGCERKMTHVRSANQGNQGELQNRQAKKTNGNSNNRMYNSLKVNGDGVINGAPHQVQRKMNNKDEISQIIEEYYKNYEAPANNELAKKFGVNPNSKSEGRAVYLRYQGPYGNQHGSIY